MALIILLVLSEDDVFNKAVHEIVSAPPTPLRLGSVVGFSVMNVVIIM